MDLLKTFYKYRKWDDKYHKRALTNDVIFFSSARRFNDPFDCTIPVRYDLLTGSQIHGIYAYHIIRMNPGISEDEVRRQAREWTDKNLLRDPEFIKDYLSESKYNEFGIFTLTPHKDNLLMWSHYSDSHNGFCIGYDTSRLDGFLKGLSESDNLVIPGYEVDYCSEYPKLLPGELSDEDWVIKQLTTKSNAWAYEEEYRFIIFNKTDFQLSLPSGTISEVILGCKMSDDYKAEIIEVLGEKSYKIDLYQTKMSMHSFSLDIEKIEY